MKNNIRIPDPRVNVKYPGWLILLLMLLLTLCLAGGQTVIMNLLAPAATILVVYALIAYWGFVIIGINLFIIAVLRHRVLLPMQKMSNAARRVAEGDLTVRIDPIRKDGKKDLMELMFDDFNSMVRELGGIEMLTSDFVSNVSHEIKTPLTVIQGYAEALLEEELGEAQRREYTATIVEAVGKLNILVTNILKLSKLENQTILPAFEEFDLCAQLTECALGFEELFESKEITFSAHMDGCATIRSDKQMLEIVWNNLLSNALKFTEPGGSITLTQTSDDKTLSVAVSDTGCGMDEATLHHIFDKFYQGDTSHSQEGNGLGLTLAVRVVKLLGGEISVTSSPGEGSAFTVRLKAAP